MTAGDELLELPFDQYQRYRVAADLVASLNVPAGSRVVDVGGAPGRVEDFLPEHDTFVVDLEGPFAGRRFAMASGAALPFPDGAFAAAIALDTLEHVPPEYRDGFIDELCRVADVVVLSAPFADPQVELAEAALHQFITQRFAGDFPTLEEHAEHGLPVLPESVKRFEGTGWAAATLPSGYLPHWLAGMLVHHELLATGLPELGRLHAYYNSTVSPRDCREPSYRHVIIAARHLASAELDAAAARLRFVADDPGGEAALQAIASAVFAQRLGGVLHSGEIHALRTQLDAADLKAAGSEREVADRDAHLLEVRAQNEELRLEVARLRRNWLRRVAARVKRQGRAQ